MTCKYAPTCGNQDCLKCEHLREVQLIDLQEYDRPHPTIDNGVHNC